MDILQDILQDISQDRLLYLYRLPPSILPDPVVWGKHSGGDRVTVTCSWFPSVELSVQDGCSNVSGLAVASSFLLTPQVDTSHDWHVEGGNARRILCVWKTRQCQLYTHFMSSVHFSVCWSFTAEEFLTTNSGSSVGCLFVCLSHFMYVRAPWAPAPPICLWDKMLYK